MCLRGKAEAITIFIIHFDTFVLIVSEQFVIQKELRNTYFVLIYEDCELTNIQTH